MSSNASGAAAGWIMFAGVIMITVGFFQAFAGLVAIVNDDFYGKSANYVSEEAPTRRRGDGST